MNDISRLLAEVVAPRNLARAWARCAHRRGLWEPCQTMARTAIAPVGPMLALAEQIAEGRYRPHAPAIVPVLKGDGSRRNLHVYMMRDRVAQRALLQVLQQRTDVAMSPGSHGYRPGRGVGTALQALQTHLDNGLTWVGDGDVEHCFDTIPRAGLMREVERRVDCAGLPELLGEWLGWPGGKPGVGLAQGAVLAPWLCNMYLWRLDDAIHASGVPLVRYADDFMLLTPTRRTCEAALAHSAKVLRHLGLALNRQKSRVLNGASPFRFLGRWTGATQRLAWSPSSAWPHGGATCC